jgi:hypothetical protein
MTMTLIVALLIVFLGRKAWIKESASYERNVELLKPPRAETTLLEGTRLAIRPAAPIMIPVAGGGNPAEVRMDELLPDHGHLMHLFLIRLPGMDRMYHLHPDFRDGSFVEKLPPIPAGHYQLFADIVDRHGYPWTMVGDLNLPQINDAPLQGDDTDWSGDALRTPVNDSTVDLLPDGAKIIWERGDAPLQANMPAHLKFRVQTKDGLPARDLEPYMGMAGHAQVVCSDLSVFAHIHPFGSVSMASLDIAQAGQMKRAGAGDSGMSMDMMGMTGTINSTSGLPPEVEFPYGFPHSGEYRIFVQIKRSGHVESAAFDAHVQ